MQTSITKFFNWPELEHCSGQAVHMELKSNFVMSGFAMEWIACTDHRTLSGNNKSYISIVHLQVQFTTTEIFVISFGSFHLDHQR